MKLFAACAPGLETVLLAELRRLGLGRALRIVGGVEFSGDLEDVQRINLWSRTASRLLVRVSEFHASSFHELERRAKKAAWERFIAPGGAARFRVTCRKSKLYHSDAVAVRLARAAGVAQAESAIAVDEPDEEVDDGGQLFVVRIANDICTISADTSGQLLHRRGYRLAVAKAPLRETLAAAIIAGSGWDRSSPLVDPMCGSGTILIEAALIARNIPPGIARAFAFQRWPEFERKPWERMLDDAREKIHARAPGRIIGSDRDDGAVKAAIENAHRAGVASDVEITRRALSSADYPTGEGWIVTNPPYGTRVGQSRDLRNLYAQLGQIVRNRGTEYRIAMLSADKSLESELRLDFREIFRTTNGGIPVRLVVS